MTKFIMIGYGWRVDFFYRIVKELPNEFQVTAAVLRTEERAEQVREEQQVLATTNLEEALETNPDFAVLCIPREGVKEYLERLITLNIPVLCETPPAKNTQELNELWEFAKMHNGRIQVAEQCFLRPIYQGWLKVIEEGTIGETSNMRISATHGYHAVSLMRKFLKVGLQDCSITAKRYTFPVAKTRGRAGHIRTGEIMEAERHIATFEFADGTVGYYDFTGEQYFSPIRKRSLQIQGDLGEIRDTTVSYLVKENTTYMPVEETIQRVEDGIYNIDGFSLECLRLGTKRVYENEFYGARLNDDELAMARCLRLMKEYVDTGVDVYSLQDAMQDTYLSFLMEEALNQDEVVHSGKQGFHEN